MIYREKQITPKVYIYKNNPIYYRKKLNLIKVCSLNKENSRELLDCWQLFRLFADQVQGLNNYKKDEIEQELLCNYLNNAVTGSLASTDHIKGQCHYIL